MQRGLNSPPQNMANPSLMEMGAGVGCSSPPHGMDNVHTPRRSGVSSLRSGAAPLVFSANRKHMGSTARPRDSCWE